MWRAKTKEIKSCRRKQEEHLRSSSNVTKRNAKGQAIATEKASQSSHLFYQYYGFRSVCFVAIVVTVVSATVAAVVSAIVSAALPIYLDKIFQPVVAVILSITFVLTFGEGTTLVVLARLVAVQKLVEENLADHKFFFLGLEILDGIIDSVSVVHLLAPLLALLKPNGKLVMVGLPKKPLESPMFSFCTVIAMDNVNIAIEHLAKADVKYRFVIDI
ncbi:mannitol dehydrogenase-like [Arachis stenosperma]|uniref:mannitol dehydrogenase-like n=1 Tax=Arachis stenosperma TaxID=217475 RepID=UPI0025ACB18A|nr:mannitol dehydrogenase-like [Arachis stenosperma]